MGNYAARDRYDYGMRWYVRDFTDSALPVNSALGAGSPAFKTITLDADSDFAVQKISYVWSYDNLAQDAATRKRGRFAILIYDSTTGRYWSDYPVEVSTMGGPATLPFILPAPKVLVAKSEISATLYAGTAPDLTDSPQFSFILNFIGSKLFRKAA